MENEEKKNETSEWRVPKRAYIGFTVFDAIHIICSLTMIVMGYLKRPINEMEIAEHSVVILFSLLLIFYIANLAEHNHDRKSFHGLYSFAWLVAVASLMVPSIFDFPLVAQGEWEESVYVAWTLGFVSVGLTLGIFVLMFIILGLNRKAKPWNHLIHIALTLILVLSAVLFVSEFFVEMDVVERAMSCIEDLAPVVPAVLGITMFGDRRFRE